MQIFNNYSELPGAGIVPSAYIAGIYNMSPVVHRFENLAFSPGPENEREHIHVDTRDGRMKIWLEPKVEVDPNGFEGKVSNDDVSTAVEQVERYYDEIKQNCDNFVIKNQCIRQPVKKSKAKIE